MIAKCVSNGQLPNSNVPTTGVRWGWPACGRIEGGQEGVDVGVVQFLWPQIEYLPTGNRNLVFGILLPPPGYNLNQMIAMGRVVEVGLKEYANVELSSGPEQINHRERVRAITIQVSPPAKVPLESAMTTIQDKIVQPMLASGQLDGGYQINLAGTADKLRDTWDALRFNVLLALVIT